MPSYGDSNESGFGWIDRSKNTPPSSPLQVLPSLPSPIEANLSAGDEIITVEAQALGKRILLKKFNSCDPQAVVKVLSSFPSTFKIRDASNTWSNSKTTLVLKLNSIKDVENAVSLALKLKECGADEINTHYFSCGKKWGLFMRFWWD